MTTIAYRDGVLAADTALTYGGTMLVGITKIQRRHDGVLVGAAGNADYAASFMKWVLANCDGTAPEAKQDDDSFDRGCIFYPSGKIEVHEPRGVLTIAPRYYAIGSGKELAIGAMHAGASAAQAVLAGIEHDPHSGGAVTILRHDG